MKKLFKKSIACLIAVLMVVSTMPFTALTAQAADTSALLTAMQAFEKKMKDGSVYTNMDNAYTAYVAASKAYDAAYYGGDASVDVTTPATNLNNAVSQMTETTLSAYTASGTARFSGDTSDISAAQGLLYSQQGVTYNSTTNTAYFAEKEVESNWNYGTSVEAELYHAPTVVLYDGTKDAKIPVITYVHSKTWGSSGTGRARIIGIAVSNSSYVSLQNSSWKGGDDDGQAFNTIYGKNDTNVSSSDNDTYVEWNHRNSWGTKYHNYDYFANLLTVSNTNLASLFSDNSYSKKIPNVTWNFYANGDNGATKYNGSQTQSDNTPIYVVNYKPLKDAITTDANKSARQNVASYKEGGMSTYLAGCLSAAGLNPNGYKYSTDLAGQVSKCASDISTAVSKFTTAPTADNTANYPKLRSTFDYSGALAGFNNATYSVRDAYNGGVNNGFTQASYDNFKAKYEAAQNVMKAVATSGYTNGSGAATAASELMTAFNALQHEHSFTGAYVNNNDGTHSQKCAFYDKCQTLSTGVAHSYTSQVTTQPTCTTAGVTTYTCACGDSHTKDEPDAKGHSWGEWSTVTAATCVAKGTEKRICNNDSTHIETRDIAIDPNNHTGLTTLEAVESTCTSTGLTEGVKCTACGVTTVAQQETAKKPHTWGDWVYDANKQEKRSCNVCGTVDSEKRDCAYVEKSVTPATCIAEGKKVYRCTQCNNEYEEILPIDSEAHNTATREETTNATCTVAGKKETVTYCTLCNKEISRVKTEDIPALGHKFTVYEKLDENSHTVKCSRNCEEEGWSYTEKHNIENGECTKCDYVAKVTITFVDENDGVISSAEYNIGADVVVPELPEQTEVYVGDSQHKVTTYSWDNEPQTTASQAATYKRVKTESTVDCSNELKQQGETSDTWYCTVCGHEYERTVTDMSALKANITALETAVNVDDAAYKYDATELAAAKETLANAKAYVANDNNRYASIQDVNAMSTSVGTAYTELTVNGLAKYSQTFIIRKDDGNGNTTDLATFTQGYENLAYGSTVEFSDYTIPTIEDESSTLNGLPMYAVYKWVKIVNGAEEKLGTTDVQISDVVKGKTTYICYVLDFKATDETQTTTRVRYLDKSGNTIKFDTATVGEPYTRKDTSIAPLIPYYNCTGWELVFGDETTVGTRELVYRAIYAFNETEANRCTIVGLNGVSVNGTTGKPGYTAYYDEKIVLTGADNYAYADEDGNIIAPINESYIFAPHLNGVDKTIYITKVETLIEDAKSIITGVFTTHEDTKYNYLVINAQYYLPEGAKAVEAGAVIGNSNNADTLKIGSAVKVVSDTQGDNHEYSLQMSYSKGKTGTLYARSYLIYVDSNGDTQTVYSDIAECVLN